MGRRPIEGKVAASMGREGLGFGYRLIAQTIEPVEGATSQGWKPCLKPTPEGANWINPKRRRSKGKHETYITR
jgi:hypothetical protein